MCFCAAGCQAAVNQPHPRGPDDAEQMVNVLLTGLNILCTGDIFKIVSKLFGDFLGKFHLKTCCLVAKTNDTHFICSQKFEGFLLG